MSNVTRAEAARLVLAAWDAAQARYTLLHGLDEHGEVGRDIDILVPAGDANRLLAIARRSLESKGFTVAEPSPVWGARILAARDGWDSVMEFHTFTSVTWRNVIFARCTGGPRDQWPAFVKSVLLPLLSHPDVYFQKAATAFTDFQNVRAPMEEKCRAFFGVQNTTRLFEALERSDPVHCNIGALGRSVMLRHALRHPLQSLASITRQAFRRVIAPLFPCAPVIGVVGPDGVGKSTLLGLMTGGSKSIYTKVIVRHWRPGLLPNLGGRRPSAPAAAPRRHAGRMPWLRVAYYFLDYLLGHWLIDRRDTCRQRLVIYDRCALDMVVDPLRYGLSSARPARWLWRFSPKPDLIILLDGDPAIIHGRKPELPAEEIASQLAAWRAYVQDGTVGAVIDTATPPEVIADKVRELAIGATMKKLGAKPPNH